MMDLGPFTLGAPLGRGAMGQVFAGVHRASAQPVAVKVLAGVEADADRRAAFRREVQAAAALHHRHVVPVHDHGAVPAGASALPAGAPYLVMALAEAGSLFPLVHRLDWPAIATLLFQLLDALAHAHARGVVHCDLKPENILLLAEPDGLVPALADFGIARALHAGAAGEGVRGTPQYMAPEQFTAPRDIGPATDLYALGCIAYELVCRRLPFTARTPLALGLAHVQAPRPPVTPAMLVPAEVGPWITRLLHRDPRGRFPGAAEAAHALARFAAPGAASLPRPRGAADDGADTWVALAGLPTLALEGPPTTADGDWALPAPGTPALPAASDDRPPLPASWRRQDPPRSASLVGAGAGLFGLRPVPFVGRAAERDAIWAALRGAWEAGGVRVVVLEGDAGTGKSRLAQWMVQRADEVGAGRVFPLRHGPVDAPSHGVRGLLRALVQPREDATDVARVARLRGAEADERDAALLSLLGPDDNRPEGSRHRVALDWLLAVAAPRVPVIWVDDAQWGEETLGLVQALLARPGAQALVVVTARAEPEAPESARLSAIKADPRAQTLRLAPLDADSHLALVERLLPLAPSVARHLAARTEGHPLFAVQLAGAWLAGGHLRPGPDGLALDAAAAATLPDDVHALWTARLDQVAARLGEDARLALELAATLGADVDAGEWKAAAAEAAITADSLLADAFQRAGLARATADGWAFSHGLVRESVLRLAAEAGRLAGHHHICARVLSRRRRDARLAERVADHHLGAGAPALAVEPLIDAISDRVERAAWNDLPRLFARVDALLADAPATDPRRLRVDTLRITPLFGLARPDEAEVVLDRTEAEARRQGMAAEVGELCRLRGIMLRNRGELDAAMSQLAEAEARCAAAGEPTRAGRAALGQADGHRRRRELADARAAIERALGWFAAAGDAFWTRTAEVELAILHLNTGRLDAAVGLCAEVEARALRVGDETVMGRTLMYRGRAEILRGHLDVAVDCLHRARATLQRAGNLNAMLILGDLAVAALLGGDDEAALAHAEACDAELGTTSFDGEKPVAHLIRATLGALRGDPGVDALLAEAEAWLVRPQAAVDLAVIADRLAARLAAAGHPAEAARVARLAAGEWASLNPDNPLRSAG